MNMRHLRTVTGSVCLAGFAVVVLRSLIWTWAVARATAAPAGQALPSDADVVVMLADEQFAKLIGICDQAIRRDRNDVRARVLRGCVWIQLAEHARHQFRGKDFHDFHEIPYRKQIEFAIHDLETAVEINPDDALGLACLGYLACQQGQLVESVRLVKRATELAPDRSLVWTYSGIIISSFDRRKALTYLDRAIELDNQNELALRFRAIVHGQMRGMMYSRAVADATKAIEIAAARGKTGPGLATYLSLRGALFCLMGQKKDGLADCDACLQANPRFIDVLIGRSLALKSLGRLDEAADGLEQYLRIAPRDFNAWRLRSEILDALGKFDDAKDHELVAQAMEALYGGRKAAQIRLLDEDWRPAKRQDEDVPGGLLRREFGVLVPELQLDPDRARVRIADNAPVSRDNPLATRGEHQ